MKKILVIEDNTDVRENLCEILQLSGYKTIEAEHGKIGVEKANLEHPDLIICDVMMPFLDGYGVLKILNQNPKTQNIPFLFLTAKAEKVDFRKGMGLGADDYITKPFDDLELLDAIETRLKKNEELSHQFANTNLSAFESESLAVSEIEDLIKPLEHRVFGPKQLIFEAGQNISYLYYVLSGSIRIFKINDFGKEISFNIARNNKFLNIASLMRDSRHSNSAISILKSKIALIPKSTFQESFLNNKVISEYLFRTLASENHEYENIILEMAYSSVRRKVALSILKARDDKNNIKLSREELASLAGVAKETLIRTLSDFKSEGSIRIENHDIHIINVKGLEETPQ